MSCADCGTEFTFFSGGRNCTAPSGCDKQICSKCADRLVLPDDARGKGIEGCLSELCKVHFQEISSVRFEATHDVYGPSGGKPVVLVHGSSGSRMQWTRATIDTIVNAGYRVFCVDLPGHGSRMDEQLTPDTAVTCLKNFYDQVVCQDGGVLWIGNSLGSYVLAALIQAHPEIVFGALLCGSGQDVCSQTCGMAAKVGTVFLGAVGMFMSQRSLMKGLIAQTPVQVSTELVEETILRPGAYFSTSSEGSILIMRQVNQYEALPCAVNGKNVWFVAGDKDHHDSIDKWAELTGGRAILYPEVDHFFSHDSRSMETFHKDILEWLKATKYQ